MDVWHDTDANIGKRWMIQQPMNLRDSFALTGFSEHTC
jgi:hypothetical protein